MVLCIGVVVEWCSYIFVTLRICIYVDLCSCVVVELWSC